jgi:hypothetical protein
MAEVFTGEAARWRELSIFQGKMSSSRDRCLRLAMSEKVMGYDDSARSYHEMADEMVENMTWVAKVLK